MHRVAEGMGRGPLRPPSEGRQKGGESAFLFRCRKAAPLVRFKERSASLPRHRRTVAGVSFFSPLIPVAGTIGFFHGPVYSGCKTRWEGQVAVNATFPPFRHLQSIQCSRPNYYIIMLSGDGGCRCRTEGWEEAESLLDFGSGGFHEKGVGRALESSLSSPHFVGAVLGKQLCPRPSDGGDDPSLALVPFSLDHRTHRSPSLRPQPAEGGRSRFAQIWVPPILDGDHRRGRV